MILVIYYIMFHTYVCIFSEFKFFIWLFGVCILLKFILWPRWKHKKFFGFDSDFFDVQEALETPFFFQRDIDFILFVSYFLLYVGRLANDFADVLIKEKFL